MVRQHVARNSFFILLAFITVTFFGLLGGFLLAVFWAIVLAILFHPLHVRLRKKFRQKPNLAAALTLAIIFFLALGPVVLVGFMVVNEATYYYGQLTEGGGIDVQETIESVRDFLPLENEYVQRLGITEAKLQENLSTIVASGTQAIGSRALGLTQNLLGFVVQFIIMLYVLYFFIRDGRKLTRHLIWVLPLGDRIENQLLQRFSSVARATVKGSLLVALIQGTLGGLLFWAVGIPGAALWGVVMIVASLLPVGNGLIWAPAGVILLLTGAVAKGIIVLVVGAAFIGLIDNLLRPRLVGQDIKMPDYLVLLSTLGGLVWFGISGFVIGPMIAAFFVTCWELMGQQYGEGRRPGMRVFEEE